MRGRLMQPSYTLMDLPPPPFGETPRVAVCPDLSAVFKAGHDGCHLALVTVPDWQDMMERGMAEVQRRPDRNQALVSEIFGAMVIASTRPKMHAFGAMPVRGLPVPKLGSYYYFEDALGDQVPFDEIPEDGGDFPRIELEEGMTGVFFPIAANVPVTLGHSAPKVDYGSWKRERALIGFHIG